MFSKLKKASIGLCAASSPASNLPSKLGNVMNVKTLKNKNTNPKVNVPLYGVTYLKILTARLNASFETLFFFSSTMGRKSHD